MRASRTGWPFCSTYPWRARRRWPFCWNSGPTSSTPVMAATNTTLPCQEKVAIRSSSMRSPNRQTPRLYSQTFSRAASGSQPCQGRPAHDSIGSRIFLSNSLKLIAIGPSSVLYLGTLEGRGDSRPVLRIGRSRGDDQPEVFQSVQVSTGGGCTLRPATQVEVTSQLRGLFLGVHGVIHVDESSP